MRKMGIFSVALFLATCSIPAWAQVTFDKVQIRTNFLEAEEGDKGKLVINSERIQFTKKDGVTEYFSIPAKAVTEVLYSSVSGRRKGTFLLTKGRKHYMALSFNDGADLVGKVEFKLHKSNYQSVLGTVEEVTGRTVASREEGVTNTEQTVASQEESVTDTEQTVASREESAKDTTQTVTSQEGAVKDTTQTVASQEDDRSGDMQGVLKLTCDPAWLEVRIDGIYGGVCPQSRALAPGQYKVKVQKYGFKDWERTIEIKAGETLEVRVEMEESKY
jgi:hypothetical protein